MEMGTHLKSSSDRLVKPGIKPVTPDLQGKWCIRYTTVAPFCSISPVSSIFTLSYQPKVTVTSCFVYKVIRDIESIDHLCINPILWIGLIYKWSIDSCMLKWSVHISVLLGNRKQGITSLSPLVGTTVPVYWIYIIQRLLHFILLMLTLKAPRKKCIWKCRLLKLSAANNCLTLLTN